MSVPGVMENVFSLSNNENDLMQDGPCYAFFKPRTRPIFLHWDIYRITIIQSRRMMSIFHDQYLNLATCLTEWFLLSMSMFVPDK